MAEKKQAFDIHRNLPPPKKGVLPQILSEADTVEAPEKHFGFKRMLASFLLIFLLFILAIGLWDAAELSQASQKMFGSGNLFSFIGGDLAGHDGRTNILLIGYSADDPGHPGATLTDSIMLLSLDSTTKRGYTLSIPRDLYVKISNFDYAKINEAYQDGQRSNFSEAGYAPGGAGLLEKVIANKFGVPVDYYALINYGAFRDTVNAVGGVTVDIKSPDLRGLYDPNISPADGGPLKLANGPQKLDGQTALNLARARGDSYYAYGFPQADFDRTEHQRQMLLALRQQAVSWKVILNPTRAGHLFDGMAGNVKTDLDSGNVLPLYSLFNKVNANNLQSISLRNFNGKNLLAGYGGGLIPAAGLNDYTAIQAAIAQLNQ
jgi:polyisoprenyl-teichoic acid--peptidoglycan teichoic acid transferase